MKRKAYFAFHYDDIMRVNNVRNAWKITHPDGVLNRSFYDSSLWESKKLERDDALKRLIRENVGYTSVVCVLVGTETYSRRWVKYEIARAVIDARGLVAVHINALAHHQRKTADLQGYNPLRLMGVLRAVGDLYYLYERQYVSNPFTGQGTWEWRQYADYTLPVSKPSYLLTPDVGYIMPLSAGTAEYDYVGHTGHKNIGSWIDNAAVAAGR